MYLHTNKLFLSSLLLIICCLGLKKIVAPDVTPLPATDPLQIPAHNMTQSQAQMSMPALKKDVQTWYHPRENKFIADLWQQAVEREREFNATHYVFYTAFDNQWRLPQDLYLKLYEKFHPLTVKIKNFRAFRWMPVHETLQEFLTREHVENGLINDNHARVKNVVVSANFALFGNVGVPGECSMEYFLNPQSRTDLNEAVYKEILDIFGCSYAHLPQIMKLTPYLIRPQAVKLLLLDAWVEKRPQTLSQVFVPKEIVDEVAYLSWEEAIPYEPELIRLITTTSSDPLFLESGQESIPAKLDAVRYAFKNRGAEYPLFKKMLEGIARGKYRVSTILEQYKNAPQSLPSLNTLQARLFIDTAGVLNKVGAGIQVFDYDTIALADKIAYEKELGELVGNIFRERLARENKPSNHVASSDTLSSLAQALRSI